MYDLIHKGLREQILQQHQWPSYVQYNQWAQLYSTGIEFATEIDIVKFAQQYEPRIFLQHLVTTRNNNWHDFFNAMVWCSFPNTKKTINQLQYACIANRSISGRVQRFGLENNLTQFDECGMVVISDRLSLLQLIQQHNWIELFVKNHSILQSHMRFIPIGHAILEKGLTPYLGMTAKALLLQVPPYDFSKAQMTQQQGLDNILSQLILERPECLNGLQPIPVLGIPGWHTKQDLLFYKNTGYFRAKRNKQSKIIALSNH